MINTGENDDKDGQYNDEDDEEEDNNGDEGGMMMTSGGSESCNSNSDSGCNINHHSWYVILIYQ